MKKASIEQYSSGYGFKSPGFTVDELGNITANSISLTEDIDGSNVVDYTFTNQNDAIFVSGAVGSFPSISIFKSDTVRIQLDLGDIELNFYEENQTTPISASFLIHSSGDRGLNAQGKSTGIIEITVPASYTEDVIYYTDQTASLFGEILINDPLGTFSSISITSGTASTSSATGSLTVTGGVGISGDLYISGDFNLDGQKIVDVSELTNTDALTIDAANNIIFKIDGTSVGQISNLGSDLPVINTNINNSTIVNSTINSSSIGVTTPATAAFTDATVESIGADKLSVTNKDYVDTNAIAFAIALGM